MYSDGPTKTFLSSAALAANRRVRLDTSNKLAYCSDSSTDCIGVTEHAVFAANEPTTVRLVNCGGTLQIEASEAFASLSAVAYAAASGKIATSGSVSVGEITQTASGSGSIIEVIPGGPGPTGISRSDIAQDALASYNILVRDLRVWDSPGTNAVVATGASDDLAVVYNTFLTAAPTVETGDLKTAQSTSRKVGFQFRLPAEYQAGQTITLRVNAGMKTTVADQACTLDAEVARQAAPTVDVCATAATTINSLVAANVDFTITPTDCVPGDVFDVVLTILIHDDASGTAVIGQINSIALLLDIQG